MTSQVVHAHAKTYNITRLHTTCAVGRTTQKEVCMTPHIKAEKEQIAKTVLLPGDPLRAKYCAENFMDDAKLVTSARNVLGYTGTYKGEPVTVLASGMGAASAGIYSYELFTEYDVDNIIRIGTSGGLQKDIPLGALVFSMCCSTDSNWAAQYRLDGTLAPCADFGLLEKGVEIAREMGIPHLCGMTFSSDQFSSYSADHDKYMHFAKMGALANDMETIAVYCNAMYTHKKALAILTMTDNCVTGESLRDEERMSRNGNMIKVALELSYRLSKKKDDK